MSLLPMIPFEPRWAWVSLFFSLHTLGGNTAAQSFRWRTIWISPHFINWTIGLFTGVTVGVSPVFIRWYSFHRLSSSQEKILKYLNSVFHLDLTYYNSSKTKSSNICIVTTVSCLLSATVTVSILKVTLSSIKAIQWQ